MKHKTKMLAVLFMAATLLLSVGMFAACTDDGGKVETVPLEGISFAEDEVTLEGGQSIQLEVIFTPENATNKNVTWEVDFEDTATVDSNGLVTAKEDAAGKACTVTATAEEGDGLYQAYCQVNVIADRGEAITKTAEVGGQTNTLTLYTLGGAELSGSAVSGSSVLPVETGAGATYEIKDNAPSFKMDVTAMGTFKFPVLSGVTFKNQEMQLRLYINNGTDDFELGTYEFTKEEAAKLLGSNNVAGGIDTTKPYIVTTIADSVNKNSIVMWSDNKAEFSIGQFVPASATDVQPITFETTWKNGATVNTIEFTALDEPVNTKGHQVPANILNPAPTDFGETSTVILSAATDTKNGITITVGFNWTGGSATASLNLSRLAANTAFDFEIPYIKTESIEFDPSVQNNAGKLTLALDSGASLDLYVTSALKPAQGVTELPSALTVGVALKEGAAADIVTISGSSITGFKAGTTTIVVTVDDLVKEIEVTVEYPENTFTDPTPFDAETVYSNTANGLTSTFTFGADGMFSYEVGMSGIVLFRSYGYYDLNLEGAEPTVEIVYFNKTVALLYGGNLFTGAASYGATVENGSLVSFVIETTGDDGNPVETVFTVAE